MKRTGDAVNKAVKVVIGLLMIVLGILFLARPVMTTEVVLIVAGILLVVAGSIEFILCMVRKCRQGKRPPNLITAIFKLFLGLLLLVADKGIIILLPVIAAVWLAAFGVYRIVLGVRHKRAGMENWPTSVAVGCIAIVGAAMLAIIQWVAAMDMIGIFIAVIAMLYGFVLLLDALVRTSAPKTEEERKEQDEAIAKNMNEGFNEFREKLHKK